MSRFEDALLRELDVKTQGADYWCLKLSWAAYQTRVGATESVKEILAAARNGNFENMDARLYSRINYVEGLYEFFNTGIQAALPKFHRARAIASGCELGDHIYPLINAWLASLYRNLGEWSNMLRAMNVALESGHQKSAEVIFRLALVIADIYQEVEQYDQSAFWYSIARDYALQLGDDAALSAMLYNRASILIYNLRLQCANGGMVSLDDGRIALEAASAQNYTRYINDKSMGWGFDLMRGQLMMLKGDMGAALSELTSSRADVALIQWPEVSVLREADVFRCRVRTGSLADEERVVVAREILERIKSIDSHGDKAIALHSIAIGLGDIDQALVEDLFQASRRELNLIDGDRRNEMDCIAEFMSKYGAQVRHLVELHKLKNG